ncbi:MAG TPA: antitoxin [Actinomycetota bacterium]|jgi:hypothetical protein
MPRTTLNIDAVVLRELKRLQKEEGKPLGLLVSELLARTLSKRAEDREPPSFRWSSKPMRARVDLADKDALYAVLDKP